MKINEDVIKSNERIKQLKNERNNIDNTLRQEREFLKELSPLQVGDKVSYKSYPDEVFFVIKVDLSYNDELEYMLSRPKKDGTMSKQSAGFWNVTLDELELIEKKKVEE